MRVLLVAHQFAYGNPQNGLSDVMLHMFPELQEVADASIFDYPSVEGKFGRRIMNEYLRSEIVGNPYDLIIFVPRSGDEIDVETWSYRRGARLVMWMFNDDWRFDQFSKTACWDYDLVVSDSSDAQKMYGDLGYGGDRVLAMPRACNPRWFPKSDYESRDIDVLFIGQRYGYREEMINEIRKGLMPQWNLVTGHFGNPRVQWNDYVAAMVSARVVVSLTRNSAGTGYQTKLRDYEALAAGAVLVSDSPLSSEFTGIPESSRLWFANADDAVDHVRGILESPERGATMSRRGQELIEESGRYKHRFVQVLQRVEELA